MTLQNKKSIFNGYNISVILLVPVITFLTIGFDTGLFPKFWDTVYGGSISEKIHIILYLCMKILEW